jgi:hypothetical protein
MNTEVKRPVTKDGIIILKHILHKLRILPEILDLAKDRNQP